MRITRLRLESWRNFREVDVALERRVFIVGPNASGKSNLLDVFKFLRDIADPLGGFQQAVAAREGVSQLRCLHSRQRSNVALDVELELEDAWRYRLEFAQNNQRRAVVKTELVWKNGKRLLERPDDEDRGDADRLFQTHLEQVNANKSFRPVADFFKSIRYLHIVPQLIRDVDRPRVVSDPYGSDFLEQLAATPEQTARARLRKINDALKVAVPQLEELRLERDERGVPHLKGKYAHWRPNAGWQSEAHFSDGTLRLLGLLWALLDGDAPLLLEEPELSLHDAIVRSLPSMMYRAGRSKKARRQVILSTHSRELLTDPGIAPEEIVLLVPGANGTEVELAAGDLQILDLLEGGSSMGDAVLPRTAPAHTDQLALFGT